MTNLILSMLDKVGVPMDDARRQQRPHRGAVMRGSGCALRRSSSALLACHVCRQRSGRSRPAQAGRYDQPTPIAASSMLRSPAIAAAVISLLQQKADVNVPRPTARRRISWAVRQDNFEMADRLIRAGANVKAANRYGVTPLYLACAQRRRGHHPETAQGGRRRERRGDRRRDRADDRGALGPRRGGEGAARSAARPSTRARTGADRRR